MVEVELCTCGGVPKVHTGTLPQTRGPENYVHIICPLCGRFGKVFHAAKSMDKVRDMAAESWNKGESMDPEELFFAPS